MAKFNGYKNWNHWNVSLWINNDEGLYHLALECIARTPSKDKAANAMLDFLLECGKKRTPDGAPYSVSSIRTAMIGLDWNRYVI
jgi:hypothetical protein